MKKAVILHGTDGDPSHNWFPWAKEQLEMLGYEVWVPLLPGNHTPNKEVYEKFLKESDWDFSDNLVIGHSSGSTTILNLLSADWFPHVNTVVMVGTFLNLKLLEKAPWYTPGQFDNLFLDNYDPNLIKTKADTFYFIHGSDDPFCDINDAREFCDKVGGKFTVVEKGDHLGSGTPDLPALIEVLSVADQV